MAPPQSIPPFDPAIAGTDFTPLSGTDAMVSFAQNETGPKTVRLMLIPQTGTTLPNKRFSAMLSSPTAGAAVEGITSVSIAILANDSIKPTLTVETPKATPKVSGGATLLVTGVAGDARGIDRVEVSLNGATPMPAQLGSSTNPAAMPYSLAITPIPNAENTLVVIAYDLRGNSTSVSRTFTYTRHATLTLYRQVPAELTSRPDSAGTLSLTATPASAATKLLPAAAQSNPRTSTVAVGTPVKITATAKKGHVFKSWLNLPEGAVTAGNVLSFTMPGTDLDSLTAEFIASPFITPKGVSKAWIGLLHDTTGTPAHGHVALLTGTLTDTGRFSGKLLIDGRAQSFTATFQGDGSAIFGKGASATNALSFGSRTFTLTMDIETGAITAATDTSAGIASRTRYSSTHKVPATLLNSSSKGTYTFSLPAKDQTPPLAPSLYPQGQGFGSISISSAGQVKVTATLADGTPVTASSALVEGDLSPFLAAIRTIGGPASAKGSSFSGTLAFAAMDDTPPPAQTAAVTATDLLWFRAPATGKTAAAQLYTPGWPQGIRVDASGSLYTKSINVQDTLGLTGTGLNATLLLTGGKLLSDLTIPQINITGNKITKVPANDPSFTLSASASAGTFKGTFTPTWPLPVPAKPAFRGILIQKGPHRGGYGFFISTAQNDPDPESGSVTLGSP